MAASVNSQTDQEMTVFSGTTHVDNLSAYYKLVHAMLLEPGWREDDFKRLESVKCLVRSQKPSPNLFCRNDIDQRLPEPVNLGQPLS